MLETTPKGVAPAVRAGYCLGFAGGGREQVEVRQPPAATRRLGLRRVVLASPVVGRVLRAAVGRVVPLAAVVVSVFVFVRGARFGVFVRGVALCVDFGARRVLSGFAGCVVLLILHIGLLYPPC